MRNISLFGGQIEIILGDDRLGLTEAQVADYFMDFGIGEGIKVAAGATMEGDT